MDRLYRPILAGLALIATSATANEVGFVEDFALAPNREAVLKQLIPGTRDYYYYHCLHYQNSKQKAKFEDMLKKWIKRYGHSGRVEEMRNRQALFDYEADPKKSMDYIKRKLGLRFHHQKEVLGRKPNLPTKLNQNLISRETLSKRALSRHRNLRGFNDSALEFLARQQLKPDLRRDLLRRLRYPDIPNLPKLVVDDLRYRHSGGFGSHGVHRKMLKTQLDETLTLMPELIKNSNFVSTYMARLRPNPDVDWEHDAVIKKAYLERLEAFADKLPPAFNSIKAHVLYQRLDFDRTKGVRDKARFMKYIKLPRNVHYIEPKYVQRRELRSYRANLHSDYRKFTALPPVRQDEALVRDYLMHFFVDEATYQPYAEFIRDTWLKRVFAETKIVNGIGDMEKWYSMLGDPAAYQRLKERVDIDFAHTNPKYYRAADPVKLDLFVKNVDKLIVKVFEINTFNYYRDKKTEVGTAINLDGLVASEENTHAYEDPPLRRVKRTFAFPNLVRSGSFVIEFIGNGRSSRAVIRKGKLRFLERLSSAGHEFMVLDEANKHLKEAVIWMGGHRFEADKDGRVLVPYSTAPGSKNIILRHGSVCTLERFDHEAETYRLQAGFFVDREALLKGSKARLLVRPMLYVCNMPASPKVLEDVSLTMSSTDRHGVSSSKEVRDLKIEVGKETVQEFQVPRDLTSISFSLKAKVQSLSTDKKVDVSDSQSFSLNLIDRGKQIEDLHYSSTSDGHILYVLGKNGEPRTDRPVQITLNHKDFRDAVHASLKTDPNGRIELGMLKDITRIHAAASGLNAKNWNIVRDRHSQLHTLNGKAGETIRIPYMGKADPAQPLPREAFSLLERRDGHYIKDHFNALGLKEGFLELRALPAGDYELRMKESRRNMDIHITAGARLNGHWVADKRILEARQTKPLQIEKVDVGAQDIKVRLRHHGEYSRVHVTATKYVPGYDVFGSFNRLTLPNPSYDVLAKTISNYLSGRDIGDEYRYILERKYAKKYPGNMLTRPGLLLNPWAVRDTASIGLGGGGGGAFGHRGAGGRRKRAIRGGGSRATSSNSGIVPNLDYLATPSPLWLNLKPNKEGLVTIPKKDLGDKTHIHVVAVDPLATAYRQVVLKESPAKRKDLRLIAGLDPAKHYTEQKRISPLATAAALTVADVSTSDVEVYDTIGKVYGLLSTLSGNAHLAEFNFILNWPKLKKEEKREKYSKYACHELSFFLFKKDPEFFKTVIKPYLANKRDKTFLDHWLLESDLTKYLEPRAFARLNIVERILLGRRIKEKMPGLARHVEDLFNLIPPNVERFNHLFRMAVQGQALETGDSLGLKSAKKSVRTKQLRRLKEAAGKARYARDAAKAKSMPGRPAAPAAKPQASRAAMAEKKMELAKAAVPAEDAEEELGAPAKDEKADDRAWKEADKANRKRVRRLYVAQEKTKEWAENNYYRLPISQQEASLVTVNAFWEAYAKHNGAGGFLSSHFPEASRNFTEMMFVLSVLDLPFEGKKHDTKFQGARMALTAGSPAIVFHKEILPSQKADAKSPLLVSQNFFNLSDRYYYEKNVRRDKYVTDEFLVHTVYGCQIVLTNPTSTPRKIDALLQIPRGAMPVQNGFYTRGRHLQLGGYATTTVEYYFYFPAAGEYLHFPVHVAKNGTYLASAKPVTLKVVEKPTKVDTESWDYISQHGTADQVIAQMNTKNIHRLNLEKIAWRVKDKVFFDKALALLRTRHVFHNTLWSYGIYHNQEAVAREYLRFAEGFLNRCGPYIESKLVTIDPIERKTYQHLEYSPLVNERAHKFGKRNKIADRRFFNQYNQLMRVLCYRPQLDDRDRMATTYYLLLQDRIEQAMKYIAQVDVQKLATRLQHDYMSAYIDFFSDAPKVARQIAGKYKDHPVDRWRSAFTNVLNQLDEAEGKDAKVADAEDRDQIQARLAAQAKSFEFSVEDKKVTINYQNLKNCQVNYYLMDLELLFSHNPFVQQVKGQFAYVKPNKSDTVALPGKKTHSFELPKEYHNANVMVEIIGGGQRKSQAYYAHSLRVQVIDSYGQVRVTHRKTGKPLSKVYVKVYAKRNGGKANFFKDGYTDVRGRFDYSSVSSKSVSGVGKFALLVMSEGNGAVIREARPPAR